MKRLRPVLAAALAALSCSATPNLLPVNDLNRPTDVTFMCFGAYDPTGAGTQLTVSGRPSASSSTLLESTTPCTTASARARSSRSEIGITDVARRTPENTVPMAKRKLSLRAAPLAPRHDLPKVFMNNPLKK